MKKSRNGVRKLNQRLNRRLVSLTTTRRLDGRRRRRPNLLARACSALNQYLRLHRKLAREHPHLYGPHARAYFEETVQLENYHRELEAALTRVYGPCATPGDRAPSRVWTERYLEWPSKPRSFRKWFRERYGS